MIYRSLDDVKRKLGVEHKLAQLGYVNQKQDIFLNATQKSKIFVGGVGTGKSTVMGIQMARDAKSMPRAHGYLLGNTYKQIITNFLPSLLAAWERVGLKENKHFVIGKKPPSSWELPFMANRNFEATICMCSGFQLSFLAADRKDMNRGSSFQIGYIDEMALIKKEFHSEILASRRRGAKEYFGEHPRFRSETGVTSMPATAAGMWILDFELLALRNPREYLFLESTTYDNIDVLGEEYINGMKLSMDELTFNREVLNHRHTRLANGFYHALSDVNLYEDSIEYIDGKSWKDTKFKDLDVMPDTPISISLDFGANFNCMTVWQYDKFTHTERMINCFHTLKPKTLYDLLDQFINYYYAMRHVPVYVYGDRNGVKSEVTNATTIFTQVVDHLYKKGMRPTLKYDGSDNPNHKEKYYVVNNLLANIDERMPNIAINKSKCMDAYLSMNNAPVLDDFKKDKRSEVKLATSVNRFLATDISDTVDYYLFPKYSKSAALVSTAASAS
jgi:hypothetical protein